MKKFKVSTKEFEKAISYVTKYGLNELFEIVIEGELLEDCTQTYYSKGKQVSFNGFLTIDEDGTVEKCIHEKAIAELCKGYKTGMAFLVSNGDSKKYWDLKEECEKVCHNNKEEDCDGCKREGKKAERFLHTCGRFNRETTKDKIQLHSQSGTDSPSIQEYLEKQEKIALSTPLSPVPLITISKEEVKLPEMLETVPKIVTELGEKINEILTYLASKENK